MPERLNQWIDVQDLTGRLLVFLPDLMVALVLGTGGDEVASGESGEGS